jgi:hypothetical protein
MYNDRAHIPIRLASRMSVCVRNPPGKEAVTLVLDDSGMENWLGGFGEDAMISEQKYDGLSMVHDYNGW